MRQEILALNDPKAPVIEDVIASFSIPDGANDIPATDDKWILSSNIQKAIRLGLSDTAIATSLKILKIDPAYLFRRLVVIAYEDIGYGDLGVVLEVLKTFRRTALHQRIGIERVAAYLVDRLANAAKNRALCDALVVLEFSPAYEEVAQRCFAFDDHRLITEVCSDDVGLLERVAAAKHVCGYSKRVGRHYVKATSSRPDLMQKLINDLGLSCTEEALYRSGQNVTESLSTLIPIVAPLHRHGRLSEQFSPVEFKGRQGVLYSALDRHTRTGKRCLDRLAEESPLLRDFFSTNTHIKLASALELALFIVEGGHLSRELVLDNAVYIQKTFCWTLMAHAGVAGEEAGWLLDAVVKSLGLLNEIRDEAMQWT